MVARQKARRENAIATLVELYGPDVTDPAVLKYAALLRGISLSGIKKFLGYVRDQFDSGFFDGCDQKRFEDGTFLSAVSKFEDLTTTHVVYKLIKDPSITDSKRMADCPEQIDPADVGPPSYFVSRECLTALKLLPSILNLSESLGA